MVVYVELAFLENFCLDLLLLCLAAYAAKVPLRLGRLCLAAALGGAFAVLFPLLALPSFLAWGLKLSVGALLPLPVLGRKKWGLGILLFFALTFLFGGALLGFFQTVSAWVRFPLIILLSVSTLLFVGKVYKRRVLFSYLYDCEVRVGEKTIRARGFLDTGNLATKDGLPVCFLAADLWYDLVGEKCLFEREGGGQGCDEMQIFTQAGVKKVPLYRGKIRVRNLGEDCENEVYFTLLTNRIGREYKILLHSRLGL